MSDFESQQAETKAAQIDRRGFLKGATALATASAFSGGLAVSSIGLAEAATPKPGGHMRFAMGHGSTTDTLDPGNVANGFLAATHYTIGNMLTEVDAGGNLLPKLAERWEASADAAAWTFFLRPGIEFHDGRSLAPEDVIASINHHRGEESTSSEKTNLAPVVEVVADGKHSVTVKLSSGDADFPFKLSNYSFPIYPANADGSLDWKSGNGCGGYKLKSFNPGVRAEYERNPNFWQSGSRAHFDSCELLTVLDVAARQNALITGEVQGIDRVDLKTAGRLGESDGVRVEEVPSKTHYTFPMRTDMAPFDNTDVRLALKYAVDREALLQKVLLGRGTVGNDHPVSSAYRFGSGEISQRGYDPDRARHHLKKAGLESLSVELSAADAAFSGAVDAAVLYREFAAPAGIDITVVREPNDGYWSNVWMNKPWCACYWPGTPTADGILSQAYAEGASWNDTFWSHPGFNSLLVAARAELDDDKRAQMYHEMQQLLHDDGGVVLPLFANDVYAVSDEIQHGPLAGNLEVDGRMFFERWWFA